MKRRLHTREDVRNYLTKKYGNSMVWFWLFPNLERAVEGVMERTVAGATEDEVHNAYVQWYDENHSK